MSKTSYVLDTSKGHDGAFLFDGEVMSNVQVNMRLSDLQADVERLKAVIRCTATQAELQVNKL